MKQILLNRYFERPPGHSRKESIGPKEKLKAERKKLKAELLLIGKIFFLSKISGRPVSPAGGGIKGGGLYGLSSVTPYGDNVLGKISPPKNTQGQMHPSPKESFGQ